MRAARRVLTVLAVLAVFALGYVWLFRTEEARVLAALDELARALRTPAAGEGTEARRARLERELSELVAGDVAIEIGGVTRARGRGELVRLALANGARRVDLELSQREVRVDDASAVVRGQATLVLEAPARVERDARQIELVYAERQGTWLLTSLTVAKATQEEPEARP